MAKNDVIEATAPLTLGCKADRALVDAVDAYQRELQAEVLELARAYVGPFQAVDSSALNRSTAVRSLLMLGLEMARVPREVLHAVARAATQKGLSLGQLLGSLAAVGLAVYSEEDVRRGVIDEAQSSGRTVGEVVVETLRRGLEQRSRVLVGAVR